MSDSSLPAIWQGVLPTDPSDYRPPTRAERVATDFLFSYSNASTRENYRQGLRAWFQFCARLHMDPLDGYGDGNGVRRSDVEKFLRWSEEVDGKARRTCAHRFSALRGYYRRAILDGEISADPTYMVKAPKVERKTTTNDLTRVQLVRILKESKARSARDHAVFCLLGLNGLRASELVGLNVTDLGRDRGYFVITVLRKGGFTQTLSISQQTAWAIEQYLGDRTEGPLFLSKRTEGKRMSRGDLQGLVKRYAKLCGIQQRISPHSFRHTFITQSLNARVNPRDVQRAAGHADARMTSYYDHGSDNRGQEATHTLSAFISEMME